jgi:hypothetical protein
MVVRNVFPFLTASQAKGRFTPFSVPFRIIKLQSSGTIATTVPNQAWALSNGISPPSLFGDGRYAFDFPTPAQPPSVCVRKVNQTIG